MMKRYGLLGLLGFFIMPVVFTLSAHAQDTPHVVISEINWAGSEISTADEWIELVNLSSEPIDVSNYVLTGVATGGGAIAIADGTIIAPSQTLLITNYGVGDPKTTLNVAPGLVTTAISLPNTALNILLADPNGVVIDSYVDAGTPDFGSTKPAVSIERDLTTMMWRASTLNTNLSFITQLGTPGVANVPVATEALQSTQTPAPAPETAFVPTPTSAPTQVITIEPESLPITTLTPVSAEPTITPTETSGISDLVPVPAAPEATPNIEIPIVPVAIEITPVAPAITEAPALTSETPVTITAPIVTVPTIPSPVPGQLVFNELVSDPVDTTEWVEIQNTSPQSIDLTGSKLVDAGNHTTLLPAQTLPSQGYLVIENPSGNLNNAGDTLTLFDAANTQLDTLTYGTTDIPAPQDGESLARNANGQWFITTATRNQTNIFPAISASSPTTTPAVPDTSVSLLPATEMTETIVPSVQDSTYEPLPTNAYETITNAPDPLISNIGTTQGSVAQANNAQSPQPEPVHRIVAIAKSLDDKKSENKKLKTKKSSQQTTITGTVVALPDVFGKQIMFLDGYELYFNAAQWPTLKLGDIVRVTGVESTNDGVPRLKISNADNIVITGHIELMPAPISGAELASTRHGALVNISGRVMGKDGNKLIVKTNDGTLVTALANKRTSVSWSQMQSGLITLTGIIKHTDSGKAIAVRSMDDVRFTTETVITSAKTTKPKTKTSPIVGGGLLTGTIGALGTWYVRSRAGI